MLTKLDDTLWHQLPATFDHVGTSDPRFFDRYWFAIYEPGGAAALQITMGLYSNMNVLDGGCVLVRDGIQHSLRVSRALRPDFSPAVGPLRVDVEEPLERLRLRIDPSGSASGESPMSCDLLWQAELPPEEEHPHFERLRGWVTQDYQRFNQVGHVDGWVEVGGERLSVEGWWGGRDHSWGVRQGVGIPEPTTGEEPPRSEVGTLFYFLFFSTEALAGHVQFMERGRDRLYLTGLVRERGRAEAADLRAIGADLSFELHDDTRRFREAALEVRFEGGRRVRLDTTPQGSAISMPGLGYGGFDDGLGLGVYRGPYREEHNRWDVRHPSRVILEDGSGDEPYHRIQPVRVQSDARDGDCGTGSLTFIAMGHLPQYGL